MRRRRIQRCVVRATIALEEGLLDQAQAAIDEALSLDPQDDAARQVAERISIAAAAPPVPTASVAAESVVFETADAVVEFPEAAPRGSRWRAFAAAVLVTMLAGASGWYWARAARWQPGARIASTAAETRTPGGVSTPAGGSIVDPSPDVQPPDPSAVPAPGRPAPRDSVTIATQVATVVATTGDAPGPPGDVERAPSAAAERVVPQTLVSAADSGSSSTPPPAVDAASAANAVNTGPAPALRDIAVSPAPALPDAPAPPPPVPAPPAADPSPASALAAGSPISAGTPLPASIAPASDPADVTGERAVRAALSRYESAYSQLDAAAAGAVWPSVDRRALTRAFAGLASQTIRLSRCDVRVNGPTAQADCTGNAQWTPKVGGGSQSAARRWRFELRQTGSAWEIVSANAR